MIMNMLHFKSEWEMAKTILGGKCRAIIIYIWKKNPIPKVRKRTEEQTQRK